MQAYAGFRFQMFGDMSDVYIAPLQVISFDVKPANVLLDRAGKHAKLADVGLAKVLEQSHTMTNMVGIN